MKFMWTKPDVAAKVKMGGILWTTGSWIVMSMTAKQGATRTKLEIYCNRKTSNWRNKEDNHLKIKKHGGLLTQVGYVEIGQQYTLAKRELLPIFFVCIQNWRDRVNFLYFFHFLVNISLLLLHIIQRFAATLLKEVHLKNGANK